MWEKHQGTSQWVAGSLCLDFETKKIKSENSVHKGAGYIGWNFSKYRLESTPIWYRMAGENFLSTEISKFWNLSMFKLLIK